MKAIQIKDYVKEISQLRITEVEKPKIIKPQQVIIKIITAAANFFDILQVKGQYQTQPTFPWIAGLEFAGIVTESTSDKYLIGDRVFGGAQGI
jgi:NADPH2:quinone reductase